MTLQFLGAAQTVTGSMHLVSVNGARFLLDCGLFQGKRADSYERNRNFPFEASSIDAVILSHAHIDHAGNLPNLVRSGFTGPIYSTGATKDLCNVMLYDSAYLQERDAEYMSRKHAKKGESPVEPLYTSADVDQTIGQFVSIPYRKEFMPADGVRATFFDAGHILGSAVTRIELREGNRITRLGFTGDLGRKHMPILKDPEGIDDVDILISESTYGGKIHEPAADMSASLLAVIKRTVDRGGKVIIPSFSVGRTQELVFTLFKLSDEGKLPAFPVFVDSPLAVNATDVFRMHPECFDRETLRYLHKNEDPFGFGRLKYIRSVEDSKKLNERKEPCVIIAASGMCEGGRILHHLANNCEESRNTILIVGFMAEHTLGRRLVERQPELRILGDIFKLRAEVAILNSFSAHAGQDELLDYIGGLDANSLKNIFLVHGEIAQAEKLSAKLSEKGFRRVEIPARGHLADFFQ
ncbi:MAG TPA: MBL fold metallo-hydrolase [Bacteroidota bacterium]|nr:MBL fold metallo-hydrolase [Bacteroidota bacterium]